MFDLALCFFFFMVSFWEGVAESLGLVPLAAAGVSASGALTAARWCGVDAALGSVDCEPGDGVGVPPCANTAVDAIKPSTTDAAV